MGGLSPLLGLEPVLFRERVHRLTVYTLFEDTSLERGSGAAPDSSGWSPDGSLESFPRSESRIPVLQRPLRQHSHRREYPGLAQTVCAGRLQFYRKYGFKEIAHLTQRFDLDEQGQISDTAYLLNIRVKQTLSQPSLCPVCQWRVAGAEA